jgi:hypothetical protein
MTHNVEPSDPFLDARPCLSSWIHYWEERVIWDIKRDRVYGLGLPITDSSLSKNWEASVFTDSCTTPSSYVVTTTSTITEPSPTECGDGIPRARSIDESVLTYTTTGFDNYCAPPHKNKAEWVEQFYIAPADAPKCRLPISECSDSWNYFKETFADWSRIAAKVPKFSEFYNITCPQFSMDPQPDVDPHFNDLYPSCEGTPEMKSPLSRYIEAMSQWSDHLFINCTQVLPYLRLQSAFRHPAGSLLKDHGISNALSPQELDRRLDDEYQCEIEVEEFVLLYFDPGIPKTRDICASSGYGEFFPYSSTQKPSLGPPVSAIVSTIIFSAHDLRDAFDLTRKWI